MVRYAKSPVRFVQRHAILIVGLIVILAIGLVAGNLIRGGINALGPGPESHQPYDVVAAGEIVPTVDLEVTKDTKSGWNLKINTENFTFTPENTSSAHVAGEGHAHVYIDGKKLGRVYSADYYIPDSLAADGQTVFVTLNTNDHFNYAMGADLIESDRTQTLP